MKHRDVSKTWMRRIGYAAVIVIAVIWIRNFVGTCKEVSAAITAKTGVCTVSGSLNAKYRSNGAIVLKDGKEVCRISTPTDFRNGYLDIIYTLDTTEGVTSEDVTVQGYEGTYYKVPVIRSIDDALLTMNADAVVGHTYYILLRDSSGSDCFMIGTSLPKEKLLPLFDDITLREE